MSSSAHSSTLRKRMIMLNLLVSGFICLLIIAYSYEFSSFERKLFVLEDFHNLFDNVLEVRRYEKNYFLKVGSEHVQTILEYLVKIDVEIKRLDEDIILMIGIEKFDELRSALDSYRSFFVSTSFANNPNISTAAEKIRQKGKEMTVFTQNLLHEKQKSIRDSLGITIFGFILITGIFFLLIILGMHLQAKSVLDRIAYVQEATRNVIEGSFQPIPYQSLDRDEITDLIHAFNRMVSELDSRQDQLIQSRKLAAIGTFSSGIAHELNNPLNNISLSADTLMEELSSLTEEETKDIVADIITQTERATEVVKNLLDFCRAKAPSSQYLDINSVIEKTEKLLANELRINAIWVENYMPSDLPPVMADMQKLQQVFVNLFVNAIQAMPEGGLISLSGSEEPSGFIKIVVSDTGPGIEPEKIEHIFEPFYTTKEVGKGTGLGLSIVYGIVKKYGGYVEVKSRMNIGTAFSIFLPSANRDKNESPA